MVPRPSSDCCTFENVVALSPSLLTYKVNRFIMLLQLTADYIAKNCMQTIYSEEHYSFY